MTQGIRTINAATATDKAALARIHGRELGARKLRKQLGEADD